MDLNGFRVEPRIIASEGAVTEPKYFNVLKERWQNPRLHVEVMTRDDASASSPTSVLGILDRFARQLLLRDGDQRRSRSLRWWLRC
jgi:hypothetical protein